jgi:DNA-binding transcriptional LysR family regulator
MSDRLQQLTVFIRAAEGGSFSRAARELGLSQPSVSRIISELEERLGVTLLLRTTRRITLTHAGTLFLDRAREILAGLEDAEDAARGRDSLRGLIRLALPVIYGTREVIPRLAEFLAAHPLLRVEMTIADERQDLIAEGADVAIRLGSLKDSAFGARKLGSLERLLVASPAYLKARGIPKTPADLISHDCIIGPRALGQSGWAFRKGDSVISVDVTGRISTDSGPGVFTSVMMGLGIAMVSSAMCGPELKAKQLMPLLRDYRLDPVDVHAVFPGGPRPSTKVRAFVDFLAERLKEPESQQKQARKRVSYSAR